MNPIIKTENLSVIYNLGKTSEIWPLNNINFEIYPQEYVIFLGRQAAVNQHYFILLPDWNFQPKAE